jgi:sugar/nucleoside kinase (ribokinase family)
VHQPGTPPARHDAFAVDVVDTTGAGDAFNGALAWALLEQRPLPEAVRLACAAGALATRGLGARASLAGAAEVYALATS